MTFTFGQPGAGFDEGVLGESSVVYTSPPFTAGRDGYHTYRIPALAVTPTGIVIALAEGRKNSASDQGDIDVVCRRSLDGGGSWGPLAVVASHGADVAGNPTVVTDPVSGGVVLLTCRSGPGDTYTDICTGAAPPRRVYLQRSTDEGSTWSVPQEISSQVRPHWMRWYGTGPGHGVALSEGAHAGRLVVPCSHTRVPQWQDTGTEPEYGGAHGIVSDDGGLTWGLGYVSSAPNGVGEGETAIAEIPGGHLYVNTRTYPDDALPGHRADAVSGDGGESLLLPFRVQGTLTTAVVQGSLLTLPDGRLAYAGPSHDTVRAAMALWVSGDAGVTWDLRRKVSGLPAAYSDMALVGADIGLLYETGDWYAYSRLEFVRIPIADLT